MKHCAFGKINLRIPAGKTDYSNGGFCLTKGIIILKGSLETLHQASNSFYVKNFDVVSKIRNLCSENENHEINITYTPDLLCNHNRLFTK